MMPYVLRAAVLSALIASTPVLAQSSDTPAPASDILVQESGPFGAPWGGYPAPTREALGRYGVMTEIAVDGTAAWNQVNLATFTWVSMGHKYLVNAYFDADTSKFNLLAIDAEGVEPCAALESRLVASLGDIEKRVEQLSDDRGTYESHTRIWVANPPSRSNYGYNFIPANSKHGDGCTLMIFDNQAGIF